MFIETTSHLRCRDGIFVAMKGKVPQDELHDLPVGFTLQRMEKLEINGINVERHVIMLNSL